MGKLCQVSHSLSVESFDLLCELQEFSVFCWSESFCSPLRYERIVVALDFRGYASIDFLQQLSLGVLGFSNE